ncbi:MAG: leucyl aminopeptidase [Ignavibacteria bacterium]|nr:MAG: leucyl aminopeptidase [Ignavibacteria bacterium]
MKFNIKLSSFSGRINYSGDEYVVFFTNYFKSKKELSEINSELDVSPNKISERELLSDDKNKVSFSDKHGNFVFIKFKPEEITTDFFRDKLSEEILNLSPEVNKMFVRLPKYDSVNSKFDEEYFFQSAIEGILLGNYEFNVYKSEKKKSSKLEVVFVTDKSKLFNAAKRKAEKLIEAVYFSRNLVNEPAITLTPEEFVKRVKKEFSGTNVKVTAYSHAQLKKMKMNAILAVGGGSDHKPILLKLEYKPSGAKDKIALVGKGVTYDSGGYSIKPTDGMVDMKGDMAGAAAVVGTFAAANKLGIKKHLLGFIPLVENMVNGSSYKPGDIVTTASGKSIEVKNTDAEGRIVLADALEYACKHKPNKIIDFATLTGACVVALGEFAAGIFTKNDELKDKLVSAGEKTYELVWPLPFMDVYKKLLDSKIADISNLGPRWGGAITAAKFLENFVDENIPYVHVDLAGPALKHNLTSYTKDWATGFGVRLMAEFLNN